MKDRRKGPDFLLRVLSWITTLSWLLMLIIMIMWEKAKPQIKTFMDGLNNYTPKQNWDTELLSTVFYLMITGVLISSIGLYINLKRNRRQDDHLRAALVLLALISIFGCFLYLLKLNN